VFPPNPSRAELRQYSDTKDLTVVWAPLALATLQAVLPSLRRGAVVITDNITGAADRYADLMAYLHDEKNGFVNTVLPYHNGLGMAVYDPKSK